MFPHIHWEIWFLPAKLLSLKQTLLSIKLYRVEIWMKCLEYIENVSKGSKQFWVFLFQCGTKFLLLPKTSTNWKMHLPCSCTESKDVQRSRLLMPRMLSELKKCCQNEHYEPFQIWFCRMKEPGSCLGPRSQCCHRQRAFLLIKTCTSIQTSLCLSTKPPNFEDSEFVSSQDTILLPRMVFFFLPHSCWHTAGLYILSVYLLAHLSPWF